MSIVQIPLRLASGAFILNSGIGKTKLSEEQAEGMRDMAANGIPMLKDLSPAQFKQFLVATEIGVGGALLAPFVPGWLAGAALTAFSGGLLAMYKNTDAMTEADGIRPSQEGTAVAKDVWMTGMGLALMADGLVNRTGRKNAAAARRAKRIGKAKDSKVEAIHKAREEQTEALRAARKDLAELRKQI